MSTGIKIGTNVPKEHILAAGEAIALVLATGAESGADQTTIQLAIDALSAATKVENVSVSDVTISGLGTGAKVCG